MYNDFPRGEYQTILIAPSWATHADFSSLVESGGAVSYHNMLGKALKYLPVRDLFSEDGCHVYLIISGRELPTGIECFKYWGLDYINIITWIAPMRGPRHYFHKNTQHCLVGMTPYRPPMRTDENGKSISIPTGYVATPKSKRATGKAADRPGILKRVPYFIREAIEQISNGPRIELFAEKQCPGWDCWGKGLFYQEARIRLFGQLVDPRAITRIDAEISNNMRRPFVVIVRLNDGTDLTGIFHEESSMHEAIRSLLLNAQGAHTELAGTVVYDCHPDVADYAGDLLAAIAAEAKAPITITERED